MKKISLLYLLAIAPFLACAEIKTKEISYTGGGVEMKGFLAWDNSSVVERPGILVVHEWWGQNEYARKRAKMLADLGYIALAVDMYGDGKTTEHPKDAGAFASQALANMDLAEARFKAAMKLLSDQPLCHANKIGAIGYCFGGSVVLHAARVGMDLKGVVSFHGSLSPKTLATKDVVKAKILVCNGADDEMISKESIAALKQEMEVAGADLQFENYKGAVHSFTNPGATEIGKKFGLPLAYNKKADEKSWAEMQKFFDNIFK
ncbi:MAG: dienelactone hydrolase family protein [Verrucomicrobiota bacterium]